MKINRKYVIMSGIVLFLSCGNVRAQSIAQLIEQLVLDTEKLTELKAILQDMYKSYEILDKGYSDIRDIVQGNFNMHKIFLDGLLAVSPAVRNYSRVVDIINTEYTIVSEYKANYGRFVAGGHFTVQELDYINKLYSALFNKSLNCVNELVMVLTADQLRMSDAERLRSIDRVYSDITGQLRVLRTFSNSTSLQAIQRAREAGDIGTLKSIYGIDN
jgi:uncharacterized protein (UPF0297 family)